MQMMRITKLTCAALLAASPIMAQDEPGRRAAAEVAARVPLERAFKGAPYSADTLIEGSQQLADGNRITRKTTGRVYRDSEGRTRREEDRPNGVVTISITDPVAGYTYSLDPANKIAWRTAIGAAGAIMNKIEGVETTQPDGSRRVALERREAETAAVAARGGGGGGFGGAMMPAMRGGTAAPLEHKVIEGVAVEGRKTTTTIPAGQVGNEQPITIVSEQWRSPELNLLILTRHSDPRSGDSSYRLLNIVRAEPDRSLFMVPADYTVRETGVRKMLDQSRK